MATRQTTGTVDRGGFNVLTPINGVTETTTSSEIPCAGAKRITWAFTRANHSSGNTVFSVDVSVDGVTFVDFNMLVQNLARDAGTGTAGEDIGTTAVASVTLSSNTTEIYAMDLQHFNFLAMKVTATETTDGVHTAKCFIEY